MKFPEKFPDKKENRSQLSFNEDGSLKIPENLEKELNRYKKFSGRSQNGNRNGSESFEGFEENDNLEEEFEKETEFDENKYNIEDNVSGFNLYRESSKLKPLLFSNNKTQEDVVSEVINAIGKGKKIIFIRGVCGTGKSAIALNIANKFEKTSIIVPGKALQKQYKDDYSSEKYVLKNNHKKLKIKVITGRANHKCLYRSNCSADQYDLPCKIEIKEKNLDKLREYLRENNRVKKDLELKDIRRISVAPVCPFWSPVIPSEYDFPLGGEKRKYTGLKEIPFTIYNRKKGCTYYNQFNSYIDSEVIVFNSAKYLLETVMNRKPKTDIEIIDECDEFLDSFSNIKRLNLNRLLSSLINVFSDDPDLDHVIRKIIELVRDLIQQGNMRMFSKDIDEVKNTGVYDLLKYFLDYPQLVEIIDEDSYCHTAYETALDFEDFLDETFVNFSFEDRGVIVNIATTNLAKKFKELAEKNNILVLMSGTIHSESTLKNIFGISDFAVIDAETINQGKIEIKETGREVDCKYENFSSGNLSREDYLIALDTSVKLSVRPSLIHVHSFDDLPSEQEKINFNLNSLITKERLQELQKNDNENERIEEFKRGNKDVLFTTKCSRGVDFPGEQCNSIIFTKYPNPNVQSIFWKVLRKTHSAYYWDFYKDKAFREFLQKIYRGVRSKDDHVYILSPDKRVLDAVRKFGF